MARSRRRARNDDSNVCVIVKATSRPSNAASTYGTERTRTRLEIGLGT